MYSHVCQDKGHGPGDRVEASGQSQCSTVAAVAAMAATLFCGFFFSMIAM